MVVVVLVLQRSRDNLNSEVKVLKAELSNVQEDENNFRLPESLKPRLYEITLFPNLNDKTYQGDVVIFVDCIKPTNIIIVNGVDFEIKVLIVKKILSTENKTEDFLVCGNKDGKEKGKWIENKVQQQIKIPLSTTLEPGSKIVIRFIFSKNLTEGNFGLYFKENKENGANWKLAASKFEPFGARLAFPCFDEPAMRAIFQFKIIRHKNLTCLFNTRKILTREVRNDLEQDEFEETKIMSTYLLMIAVFTDNYNFKDNKYRDIKLRAFAPEGDLNKVLHALDVTRQALHYFETRTGIRYPGTKLDLISIQDYDNGAMESWGLIPFAPFLFLYSNEADDWQRILVTMVTTHELAHHWFGNYVAIKWWNDLWLKEGVATYFHKDCLEKEAKDAENLNDLMIAMNEDCHFSSHPLSLPDNYNDALSLLHDFVYKKGCSLLNMVESFMGREKFDEGLKIYLYRHRYRHADAYDWWNAMTDVYYSELNKLNLSRIMEPWMKQTNFPLLHVNFNDDRKSFTVRQERFLLNKREIDQWELKWPSKFGYLWEVPVKFRTSKNSFDKIVWLKKKEETFHLNESVSWVKLNYGHYGYYVTNYDKETWTRILEKMKNKMFDSLDIAGILFDLKLLLKSGQFNITMALEFLPSLLESNPEPLLWKVGYEIIQDIFHQLFSHKDQLKMFKSHMKDIVEKTMRTIGKYWTKKSLKHYARTMHSSIFETGILADETDTREYLLAEFDKMMRNASYQPMEAIVSFVLPFGIASSGSNSWEIVWERYKNSSDNVLLTALCATYNWQLLEKLLQHSINCTSCELDILTKISETQNHKDKVWKYFISISTKLQTKIDVANVKTSPELQLVKTLAKTFKTEEDLKKVKDFFDKNALGQFMNEHKSDVLEIILMNIHWHDVHFDALKKYYEMR